MKEKKIKNGITYVILGIVGVVMLFPCLLYTSDAADE